MFSIIVRYDVFIESDIDRWDMYRDEYVSTARKEDRAIAEVKKAWYKKNPKSYEGISWRGVSFEAYEVKSPYETD